MQNDTSFTSNHSFTNASKSHEYDLQNDAAFTFHLPQASSLTSLESSRLAMKHQDLVNRTALCLKRLREAVMEVESLRHENAALRSINSELNNQLSCLIQASIRKHYDSTPSFVDIGNCFRNLSVSGGGYDLSEEDESPTSVMEVEKDEVEKVSLPKSISVRSNGYLKMNQQQQQQASSSKMMTRGLTRPRTASPLINAAQKVFVRRGKKEEEPLELEVYDQGMFKTELCNKWQETRTCPYGDHCQFAHGIEELRPVIRHPRYKTEVCRMVLAGDICPYGHRCHFRHSLTEQERFMGHIKSSAIKLDR